MSAFVHSRYLCQYLALWNINTLFYKTLFLFDEKDVKPISKCKLHDNVQQKLPTSPKENIIYLKFMIQIRNS